MLLNISKFFSAPVGTWVSGIPTEIEFEKGMENEIAMPKKKRVYKIVSVIQPPFMQWNETESKIQINFLSPKSQSYSHCLSSSSLFIAFLICIFFAHISRSSFKLAASNNNPLIK